MTTQPEALRLAELIDWPSVNYGHEAAAELRRLHEEVQEQCRINGMGAEREARLMAINQELLEALKGAANYIDTMGGISSSYRQLIAKAGGNK